MPAVLASVADSSVANFIFFLLHSTLSTVSSPIQIKITLTGSQLAMGATKRTADCASECQVER